MQQAVSSFITANCRGRGARSLATCFARQGSHKPAACVACSTRGETLLLYQVADTDDLVRHLQSRRHLSSPPLLNTFHWWLTVAMHGRRSRDRLAGADTDCLTVDSSSDVCDKRPISIVICMSTVICLLCLSSSVTYVYRHVSPMSIVTCHEQPSLACPALPSFTSVPSFTCRCRFTPPLEPSEPCPQQQHALNTFSPSPDTTWLALVSLWSKPKSSIPPCAASRAHASDDALQAFRARNYCCRNYRLTHWNFLRALG